MDTLLTETAVALQSEWGLTLPNTITEEQLLQLLADKLTDVMAKGPDAFYQLMYRLDIPERKLRGMLANVDVAHDVAKLVYERQLQKVRSRAAYRNNPPAKDDDLKW